MNNRWPIVFLFGAFGAVFAFIATRPPELVTVQRVQPYIQVVRHEPVHLLFVGDIMLSRSVGDAMRSRDDWQWPFAAIASAIADADLAFGNLESVISDRGTASGCGYCFRADPRSIAGLTTAGFDVLSVANNHAWDYGPEAFLDSLVRIRAGGIDPVGGSMDLRSARTPVIRDAGSARVAYLAYTDLLPASACASAVQAGVNCYDSQRMHADIAAASDMADIVVISFHAGTEYEPHTPHQEQLYRAAIDAGADLVIGHHPHVVQDVERYGNGWIAYSLGNFVFDQGWSAATTHGLLVDATVEGNVITSIATRSIQISPQYQAAIERVY